MISGGGNGEHDPVTLPALATPFSASASLPSTALRCWSLQHHPMGSRQASSFPAEWSHCEISPRARRWASTHSSLGPCTQHPSSGFSGPCWEKGRGLGTWVAARDSTTRTGRGGWARAHRRDPPKTSRTGPGVKKPEPCSWGPLERRRRPRGKGCEVQR